MRRIIIIWVMAPLIVITVVIVLIIDSKLYCYGKNNWGLHEKLPLKMVPQYWSYDRGNLGFVLERDGEVIVAKGIVYWDYPNISINEILKYAFNKAKLMALVNDSLGKRYYVICEEQVDIRSKQELKISIVPEQDFIPKTQFKWIKIKNVSKEKMELGRNYLEIFLILLIFIMTYCLLKNRKNTPSGARMR